MSQLFFDWCNALHALDRHKIRTFMLETLATLFPSASAQFLAQLVWRLEACAYDESACSDLYIHTVYSKLREVHLCTTQTQNVTQPPAIPPAIPPTIHMHWRAFLTDVHRADVFTCIYNTLSNANLNLAAEAISRIAVAWEQFSFENAPSLSAYTNQIQHRLSIVHTLYQTQSQVPASQPPPPQPPPPQPHQLSFQHADSDADATTVTLLNVRPEQNAQPHQHDAPPHFVFNEHPVRTERPTSPSQPLHGPALEEQLAPLDVFQQPHWKQQITLPQRHAVIRFIHFKLTENDAPIGTRTDPAPSSPVMESAKRIEHGAFEQSQTGTEYLDRVITNICTAESNQTTDASVLETPIAQS